MTIGIVRYVKLAEIDSVYHSTLITFFKNLTNLSHFKIENFLKIRFFDTCISNNYNSATIHSCEFISISFEAELCSIYHSILTLIFKKLTNLSLFQEKVTILWLLAGRISVIKRSTCTAFIYEMRSTCTLLARLHWKPLEIRKSKAYFSWKRKSTGIVS